MPSSRCAVCKHFRRKCPSDCIFSPYFPPNDPQRFASVHEIYGASNIGKILQQVPVDQRAEAIDSLYFEAQCRKNDRVYGCVGVITLLQQEISKAQAELAKTQAEIACLHAHADDDKSQFVVEAAAAAAVAAPISLMDFLPEDKGVDQFSCYPSSFWP